MRLALGAPVAGRAWILPHYLAAIARQTLVPRDLCFLYSESADLTRWLLMGASSYPELRETTVLIDERLDLPFYSREIRNRDTADPNRAIHFSALRNALREMFLRTDADVFVSLDTDIILDDPTSLERLVAALADGWDVACARTCLHPLGGVSECYNAGFWPTSDRGDFRRPWGRATRRTVEAGTRIPIDIPMAAYAITREALEKCEYKPHEAGEDLGFADELDRYDFGSVWCTDVVVRHVWSPDYLFLEQEPEVAVDAGR